MTVNGNADGQRSGKMSKNIENAILLDTYGSMLTEKQYDTLSLYYDEDLSLSEIAENMGITRQGVHKCIRTAEEYLTQLEETLGFAQKYRNVCDLCDKLTALTDETIQLFSLGRSSQVTDVWIDFAGVVTGTLLVFLVQAIVRRCKKS